MIGNDAVGDGPCWTIAEAGINHNGSMDLAHAMIDVAAEIGADAIKWQKRTVEVVYTEAELAAPRDSRFGKTNGDLKRGLEFSTKQYGELGAHAAERGIAWGASVWDEFSVADLVCKCSTRPNFLKIASPTLTNKAVLQACAAAKNRDGIPVILSTGMSTLEEIRAAVDVLGRGNLILLHCVSAYPPPPRDLNLHVMDTLRAEFGCPVGYSGHEDGIEASVAAAGLGACIVERHFTLCNKLWGSDQKVSLEPRDFEMMLERIWENELFRGSYDKALLECELAAKKKLRR